MRTMPPMWWMIFMAIVLILGIFRFYRNQVIPQKIQNAVRKLGTELNDSGVQEFIGFISSIRIPNQPKAWNACRAAYELVRSSNRVSTDVKERLKHALLSGGVSGIR